MQLWKNGPYWADCNVGATKPEEYGYYFWWGDTVGYKRNANNNGWISVKDGTTTISFSDSSSPANSTCAKDIATLISAGYIGSTTGNLVAEHDAATAHLGDPWRMPTDAEFANLTNKCSLTWTDNWNDTGVAGCVVTGKEAGYTDKSIFLPATGYGILTSLYDTGSSGVYWSSTPNSDNSSKAWYLYFDSLNFKRESNIRSCGQPVRPVYVPPDYLTFTAEEDGSTVALKWASGKDVMINTNGAWVAYSKNTPITLAKVGDKVMFKGNGVTTDPDNHFTMAGKIAASGDVGTLTDGKGGADVKLATKCYTGMFAYCTALTAAPALPATNLTTSCCESMFSYCTALTAAPALPATNLASRCYNSMFRGCTSLTAAPALPATNLARNCYASMFRGCTSLTNAPALPAMTLALSCYDCMFAYCTALTAAPDLPAMTLAGACYGGMFRVCTALKVNAEGPGTEWSIPDEATEKGQWNQNIFDFGRGTAPYSPSKGVTYYVVPTVAFTPVEVENATWEIFEDNSAWTLKDKVHTNATIKVRYTAKDGLAFADGSYVKTVYVGKADADPFAPTGYAPAAPTEWTQSTASTTVDIDTRTDKTYFDADDILPVWAEKSATVTATNTSMVAEQKQIIYNDSSTANWYGWKPAYLGKYQLTKSYYDGGMKYDSADITYTTAVYVSTNAALDVADTTWALVDAGGSPITDVDDQGRFIVPTNSQLKVVYTLTKDGYYFKDGTKTYEAAFTATGAEEFDAATMIGDAKPKAGDIGQPKVQLGVVAQRYPWDGCLDVQYKALYVPEGVYALAVKVKVEGEENTALYEVKSGIDTVVYDVKANFGEVKTKNCKVTAKLVTAE